MENTLPMILETTRLRLRAMNESDLDFLASMLGDPEVMRYYPKPLDREEASAWYQRVLACYAKAGYGFWMVEKKDSGLRVAQIGLLPKEIDGQQEVEVAYMVHRPFWRQGIATEAASACRDHALDVLKVPRVICMIRPMNTPSLHVAAKLGMRRIGETKHQGFAHDLYGYSRSPLRG